MHENNCKKDEIKRKEDELFELEERLRRNEEEIEDDTSCTIYSVNELKK
jgi:hypothetical protein